MLGVRRTSGAARCPAPPAAPLRSADARRLALSRTAPGTPTVGAQVPPATRSEISASLASGSLANSEISSPSKVTDSASGLSRFPWQAEHTALLTNWATRFFTDALFVVANVSSTYRRAPTNVP